ncbi:MAG TPA: hypothetical protein VK991_03435 [Halomonas sp.]|nr:hypothetical protein [Halomonas sp.]
MDQAAGLRNWASTDRSGVSSSASDDIAPRGQTTPAHTLIVIGLPGNAPDAATRVTELLDHWQGQGHRWIGSPLHWRVVPLDLESPHLATLARHQSRWALWVDADAEAFRRAFSVLRRLHERHGPRRLIAVHSPHLPRRGLLENLRQAAASCLGIELLVLAR